MGNLELFCILLTPVAAISIYKLPSFITAMTAKEVLHGKAADHFYEYANKLLADERTPQQLIDFLNHVSHNIGSGRLVRNIAWSAIVGRMKRDVKDPPQAMRDFLREVSRMPEPLRNDFARAMSWAFVASALKAGLLGEVFLRVMLPDPERQKETSTTYAAELHGTCTV